MAYPEAVTQWSASLLWSLLTPLETQCARPSAPWPVICTLGTVVKCPDSFLPEDLSVRTHANLGKQIRSSSFLTTYPSTIQSHPNIQSVVAQKNWHKAWGEKHKSPFRCFSLYEQLLLCLTWTWYKCTMQKNWLCWKSALLKRAWLR